MFSPFCFAQKSFSQQKESVLQQKQSVLQQKQSRFRKNLYDKSRMKCCGNQRECEVRK